MIRVQSQSGDARSWSAAGRQGDSPPVGDLADGIDPVALLQQPIRDYTYRTSASGHLPAANFLENAQYVAFGPPNGPQEVVQPTAQPAQPSERPILDRVRRQLSDSANPIGDVAAAIHGLNNVGFAHTWTRADGSRHFSIDLHHATTSPPPIGMDQGRHHAGMSYTGTHVEADISHTASGALRISNIQGVGSEVHTDRLLPGRQRRLGPRTREVNTHEIELGTDASGHGYMTVNSGVVLPFLGRERPNTSTLREQNLPPGAMRDLIANPETLQNMLRAATLYRPDHLSNVSLRQTAPGRFEIIAEANAPRDIPINQQIPNSPLTIASIHLDRTVSTTLAAGETAGQPTVSLENLSGIQVNISVPEALRRVIPATTLTPRQLRLQTINGTPSLQFEIENPAGGKPITHAIPLSTLLAPGQR